MPGSTRLGVYYVVFSLGEGLRITQAPVPVRVVQEGENASYSPAPSVYHAKGRKGGMSASVQPGPPGRYYLPTRGVWREACISYLLTAFGTFPISSLRKKPLCSCHCIYGV